MNLKDLKTATTILRKVESLDQLINEIEKIAISIANNKTKSSFSFSIKTTDLSKKEEESNEIHFDADGSLHFSRQKPIALMGIWERMNQLTPPVPEDKNSEQLSFDLSEEESLMLLEIMVKKKMFERELLLEQLSDYGYSHK